MIKIDIINKIQLQIVLGVIQKMNCTLYPICISLKEALDKIIKYGIEAAVEILKLEKRQL